MRTGPGGAVSREGGLGQRVVVKKELGGFGGTLEILQLSVKPLGFEDTQDVERGRQWGGGLLGAHGGKPAVQLCLRTPTGR